MVGILRVTMRENSVIIGGAPGGGDGFPSPPECCLTIDEGTFYSAILRRQPSTIQPPYPSYG